jgi:ribosome biogenesis GTPase / thiamine phosphate phosphatase
MKDDHLFFEEKEHEKNKKASRQERKRLSEKDRSKYKKTDLEKIKPESLKEGKKARVLQIGPESVLCSFDHTTLVSTLKGSLKKEKRLSKNIIACGDEVIIDMQEASPTIIQILPRKTVLSRADNLSRKKEQVIAANIDQVFITTSILEPVFKSSLIDRYLIAAYKGNLDPIILITKMDLVDTQDENTKFRVEQEINYIKNLASSLDVPLIFFSKKTLVGLDLLKKYLKGKTSVFSGQSGVGKSSIINLITEAVQDTQPVVSKTMKGSHTTTQAIMLPLKDEEGYCIDTPGIRSFGLWEIDQNDIKKYFKEIDEAGRLCKYPDCTHLNEPDCNVQILLEEGKIDPLRFYSYSGLMEEAKNQHLKR